MIRYLFICGEKRVFFSSLKVGFESRLRWWEKIKLVECSDERAREKSCCREFNSFDESVRFMLGCDRYVKEAVLLHVV